MQYISGGATAFQCRVTVKPQGILLFSILHSPSGHRAARTKPDHTLWVACSNTNCSLLGSSWLRALGTLHSSGGCSSGGCAHHQQHQPGITGMVQHILSVAPASPSQQTGLLIWGLGLCLSCSRALLLKTWKTEPSCWMRMAVNHSAHQVKAVARQRQKGILPLSRAVKSITTHSTAPGGD